MKDFGTFTRSPDEVGLNEAILDVIQLIEEGQVQDPEACLEAIEKASNVFCDTPQSPLDDPAQLIEACPIPVESDGLPEEETIAFLFDHVTEKQVKRKVTEDPAYMRLAALRERVLERFNKKARTNS